jgi:hypothetical protein
VRTATSFNQLEVLVGAGDTVVVTTAGAHTQFVAPVAAQSPPSGAAEAEAADITRMQRRLRTGDRVDVFHQGGRIVEAHFVELRDGQLVVTDQHAVQTIPMGEVTKVQRRRRGMLLGAIIGAAAGAAASVPLYMLSESGGGATAAVFIPLGVGLGAGIGIDALVNLPRTEYERPVRARLLLSPAVMPHGGGASLRVTF